MSSYKIKVDLMLCQGHGVCTEECPEVFAVEESETHYSKVKLLTDTPSEALRTQVEDAIAYCPNRVISLLEVKE